MTGAVRSSMSSEHDSLVVEIRDLFRQLDRVASRADRFGWDHPATTTVLNAAEAAFIEALERSPRTLRVEIRADAFIVDDLEVWVPPAPLDDSANRLFSAGIRAVQVLPGVRARELRAWIGALLDARNGTALPDDDVRTALWDAALAHVRFEIVDADRAAKKAARITLKQPPIDRMLRSETLRDLLRQTIEPTATKLVSALTTGLLEATPEARIVLRDRIREAALSLIERGELRRLLDVHQAAHDLASDPEDERAAGAKSLETALFEGDALPAALELLRAAPRDVRRFGRILEFIDASRIGDALAALRLGADGELRDVLEKFVERAARGHEAEVARAIVDSPRAVAVRLLAALARVHTSAAAAEISRLSRHGDEDVRLDAKLLGAHDPVRAEEDIVQMVDSPDAATRAAALRAIGRHCLQGAAFTLLRRLRVPSFVDLEISEQAELLRALLMLSPEQGESIALEILRTGGMFQSDAREATRLVAVELLGEHGVSAGAVEALRDAAKTHWGASRTMRDAAENAARALDDRLAQARPISQAAPSQVVEIADAPVLEGSRFDFVRPNRRVAHAESLLDAATRADGDTSLALLKCASQALADLRDIELASVALAAIQESAHRDETQSRSLVAILVAGAIRQLGAPSPVVAQTAFAALDCENARGRAKSLGFGALASSSSFGRLDDLAARRVILAVESLADLDAQTAPSVQAQVLATARRFVRALAGRSSASAEEISAVLDSMKDRTENPVDALTVQLVGRALDPPLTATARGTLDVTPFVHLLAYMLDHRSSGSIELTSPSGERAVVVFRDGAPIVLRPRAEGLAFDLAFDAIARLPAETKYVFYKDVDLVDVTDERPHFRGDLCLALHAARCFPDRARVERMLARIAHRRLVLHPRARVEGLDSSAVDRDVIAALRRGVRLPELRAAHPEALAEVDSLIYVLAVMRQMSLPGQVGEPIGAHSESAPT